MNERYEQTDERVAQYSRPDSWLYRTKVRSRPRRDERQSPEDGVEIGTRRRFDKRVDAAKHATDAGLVWMTERGVAPLGGGRTI